jgi:hypothetical protein
MVGGLRHDLDFVTDGMVPTWAPDDLWQVAQPLIPVPAKRPAGWWDKPSRRPGSPRGDRVPGAGRVFLVAYLRLADVLDGLGRTKEATGLRLQLENAGW